MRNTLLLLAFVFIIGAFAVLLGQTANVGAMGAPTDNTTMPNAPTSDQSQDEIKPPVEYVLLAPSLQPEGTLPNFIVGFIGTSDGENIKVTADENWYLDLDINTPGWLYIYEYFPVGDDFQGKWIAYKWQLPQGGIWRLGPFTPGDDEPEGQHIYQIWFYSGGQWATGDPNILLNNLVYWTYSKDQPAAQPAGQIPLQPPIAPVEKATFLDKAYEFVTQPVILVLGTSLLVIIVMVGLYRFRIYTRWGRGQDTVLSSTGTEPEEISAALPSAIANAKIVLPNGVEIQLAESSRVIGRGDLARALSLDDLVLISRRHFKVKLEDEQFYIEDMDSSNGTQVNGEDISGRGPVSLNDGDIIEPASAIRLKFQLL